MRLVRDPTLREAFRAGERDALAEVYGEYAPRLRTSLARGFVFRARERVYHFAGYRDRFELEDALQEVFVRAFSPGARRAYDGLRPFSGYLFAIARNRVLDSLRRPSAGVHVMLDAVRLGELLSDSVDAPVALAQGELRAQLARFVASLDGDRRRIFELRLVEDHSIRTVASALRLSEHRVKRAERDMRKQIELWFSSKRAHMP